MLFQRVQRDSDVCNNCFRRTHQTFERNYAKRVRVIAPGETEIYWEEVDLPDDRIKIDRAIGYVDADSPSDGQDPVCACGWHFGEKYRPLPKDMFVSFGEHLAERYLELGHHFPVQSFLETLERLKSDPDNQFRDDDLYMRATRRVVLSDPNTVKAD